jgi:hypothetical protein
LGAFVQFPDWSVWTNHRLRNLGDQIETALQRQQGLSLLE